MGNEHQIIIDSEKCIGCGLCVKDCVGENISIVEKKAVTRGNSCIMCGHCEAVCPKGAVCITGYEDEIETFDEQTRLDPEQLLKAIKTRRTIRQFKDEKVSGQAVDMILEAGRMAPTGTNAQGTAYVLIEDKLSECEAAAVSILSKIVKAGRVVLHRFLHTNIGPDFFFKGAPLVIVVLGSDRVSASLAAENMAFMAEAQGLGVLYSGFFTVCFNISGKVRRILGVKKQPKAVTTLVIGHPAVKYYRTPHRKPVKLIRA